MNTKYIDDNLLCDPSQVIPVMPPSIEKYQSQKESLNKLKIKVLQLRNRLGRQKKIRGLNERSLKSGEKRAHKMEELLVEMQTDLTSLKGRLQEELNELGIGKSNGATAGSEILERVAAGGDAEPSKPEEQSSMADGATAEPASEKRIFEDGGDDPETKRARVE